MHEFTASHIDSCPPTAGGVVVIDGLNVIRHQGYDHPRLELLLHVVLELAVPATDFLVICDGNTWHELRAKQSPAHAAAFAALCRDYPDHFVQCTGGTEADALILAESTARNGRIISNDLFRPYRSAYPWLNTAGNRALRLNQIREKLYVGNYPIHVNGGLNSLMQELVSALKSRISPSEAGGGE